MEGLGIDLKLLLAQIFNFLVLFVVLKKFLYRPLLKFLDERKKKIDESLLNVEKINKKLMEIEEERNKILKETQMQAKQILAEERKQAEEEKEQIITMAKAKAAEEIKKGSVLARQELEEAKLQLRQEAIVLAEELTKKLLSNLSEEDQHKIIKHLNN